MSLLKKLVGLAVGAAAVGAAAYLLNRDEHTEEYEHIVGPEDEVETDSAEPAEDASAAAETPAPADPENVPAEAEDTAAEVQPAPAKADETPNVNPVELGAVEVPKTEDGKLDATKIADPADFGDWEEQGCKG
ncbi:hypothetical protein [uncultured Gemmiger sp.]|uniref:hypothetical protein n=1 Tax=uncultured Gemmiger sp. TaxID=1623490 RepID=UPI0025F29D53|nr:hypothetical protein [uncultured Gemmiger sp.]